MLQAEPTYPLPEGVWNSETMVSSSPDACVATSAPVAAS
jgi:hypothetical protein